ncbi:MAG: tetratricopeptide repeat protein [Anaerolineae bacterium]|nr:tetratricopeptide repeat protein [Gloeobacterales cyanobacterium ES-bin-313]
MKHLRKTTIRLSFTLCLSLVGILGTSQSLLAQTPTADQVKALFKQCVEKHDQSDFRAALPLCLDAAKALKQFDRSQNPSTLGKFLVAYLCIGNAYYSLGEYQKAIDYHTKSLQMALQIGDKQGEGAAYGNLGLVYRIVGEYQKAIEFQNKRLQIALQMGDKEAEGQAYLNLGGAYYSIGDYPKSIEFHNKSLQISLQLGDKNGEGLALGNLGLTYNFMGDYQKAIEYYNKSLKIALEAGDRQGQGRVYGNLGLAYYFLGDYQKAIDFHRKALQIDIQIGDKNGEGLAYGNIGLSYRSMGEYQKAIEYQNKSLQIAIQIGDKQGQGRVYANLGLVSYALGEYQKAIEYHKKSLQILQEIGDKNGEGTVFGNIGLNYYSLGDYQKAIEYQNKSLQIAVQIGDKQGEGRVYANLGGAYYSLSDFQRAIEFHLKALQIFQQVGDRNGEGTVLGNLGLAYYSLGEFQKAIEFQNKSLQIAQLIGDKQGEGRVYGSLGNAYYALGADEKAIEFHNKRLQIVLKIGDKQGEGQTYVNLGLVYEKLQKYVEALRFQQKADAVFSAIGTNQDLYYPQWAMARVLVALDQQDLAVLFYKQAVNTIQTTKEKIKDLDPALKKSFGDSKSFVYRQLADLLLKQSRVLEAQKALDLLKEQEVNELLRSASGAGGKTSLNDNEQKTWQSYQKSVLGKELEIYKQRDLIDDQIKLIPLSERPKSPNYKDLSQKRAAIEQQIVLEVQGFEIFLKQAAASLKAVNSTVSMEALQAEVVRYNDLLTDRKAAVISTLVLPDRLELILLTPNTKPLQRTVKVKQAELDALILQIRRNISSPGGNSLPDLQKLYQYLVAPLELEIQQLLKDDVIDTLVFAPDQNLRLIPLEALHDGKQYLVERLPIGVINSLSRLSGNTLKQPQMLAMGLSKVQSSFPEFSALPSVISEVNSIGKLYNGQIFLNEQFTKSTIQESLGSKQPLILHLATHASFGNTKENIFILLFGEKLGLEDLKSLDLRKISLLTLSACETAAADSRSGVGLASIAGGPAGAQSVLGSLWPVSDRSTSFLMQRLYTNMKAGMPKAEALRRAQLTFIHDQTGTADTVDNRGGVGVVSKDKSTSVAPTFSDPFYWAPFILIGDWH